MPTPNPARRTRKTRPATPLGLRIIFSSLQPDGCTPTFAIVNAKRYATAPEAILAAQAEHASTYSDVLYAITNRVYPGDDHGPDSNQPACAEPSMLADASFWAGVATCWHLMTAVSSAKAGAR